MLSKLIGFVGDFQNRVLERLVNEAKCTFLLGQIYLKTNASDEAIAEKTKAEKAKGNTAVPEAAAVKATATQAVAVKPSDRSSVLRFAAKQDNVGSAKVKAKVILAATKELAGPALAAAAKALGPNTSYREMCVEAQKIAKSVEEIDAIAALWKTYTRQMARAKKCH